MKENDWNVHEFNWNAHELNGNAHEFHSRQRSWTWQKQSEERQIFLKCWNVYIDECSQYRKPLSLITSSHPKSHDDSVSYFVPREKEA